MSVKMDPKDVSAWLRENGNRLLHMADDLDRAFSPPGVAANVTPETIREMVGSRKMRRRDIALEARVSEDVLEEMLTPENGFEAGSRGWYRVCAPPGKHPNPIPERR